MSLVQFRPEAYADLAHLVERNLAKVEVAGPSPVIRLETVTKKSRLFLCAGHVPVLTGESPVAGIYRQA